MLAKKGVHWGPTHPTCDQMPDMGAQKGGGRVGLLPLASSKQQAASREEHTVNKWGPVHQSMVVALIWPILGDDSFVHEVQSHKF